MTAPFRALDEAALTIEVLLDGIATRFDPARSILANLLLARDRPFLCAIGHCQMCLISVDSVRVLACRTYPRGGEHIETPT